MDRQAFQTGQLIPNGQLLGMEKSKLVALGYALEAVMGAGGTVVSGLACTPTTSPSLSVVVGRGSIMTTTAIDGVAYSDLGTDTNATIKQGILQEPGVTLTLTPPSTAGYSQVYLIQAKQSDNDVTTTVPFYNASNPAQPYNGPGNSGNATLTLRQSQCVVSLKPGAAATTGSQVAPSPDLGNVGLYTITLVNGQSTITSGQIVQLANAPFVPVTLPNVPAGVQSGAWVFGADTGAADNYVVTLTPNTGTVSANQRMFIKFANTNATTTPALNVNGTGSKTILNRNGAALAAGDVPVGWREVFYDGTNYRMAGAVTSELPTFPASTSRASFNLPSSQSVTNNTTTQIGVNGTAPAWATISGSTVTITKSGNYAINLNASGTVTPSAQTSHATIFFIYVNGSNVAQQSCINWTSQAQTIGLSVQYTDFLAAGSTISFWAYLGNSGTTDTCVVNSANAIITKTA